MLGSPFLQTLTKSYLVLVWGPLLHTPYISSSNRYLLFAAHANTTATCYCCNTEITSSIPNLSLSSLLGNLSFSLTPHIQLTIEVPPHFISLLAWSLSEYTHPFNGPCPGLPGRAGTRNVKPIWILLKQETVSWAICKSAPFSRQITTPAPHHSVFYRPDALPVAQPTAS